MMFRFWWSRPVVRGSLSTLAALLVTVLAATPALARTNDVTKPTLFVHGYDNWGPYGNDCEGTWGDILDTFRAAGWRGTLRPVKFYHADTDCDPRTAMMMASVDHHGSHTSSWASGHRDGSHTNETSIRHLAHHLAWWIYDHYSKNGQHVDVVAHSMGGLIIRYALTATGRSADFPPLLRVEDVVTFGTPHNGTVWAGFFGSLQAAEMRTDSTLIRYLTANGLNPRGSGGTDWTVIGSTDDYAVGAGSATAMAVRHRVVYWFEGVRHGEYMHRTNTAMTADTYHTSILCGGGWCYTPNGYWPVSYARMATHYGSW